MDWYFLDDALDYVERLASQDVTSMPEVRQFAHVDGLPLNERMVIRKYVFSPSTKTWRQIIRHKDNG